MKVKIKKLSDKAVVPFKHHSSDFCYDMVATSCTEVSPNVYKYELGFAAQIERDWEKLFVYPDGEHLHVNMVDSKLNLSLDIRPRSSIYKTGMVLANSIGTGDENYTGGYAAIFYHVIPTLPKYEVGDRVAQLKIGITLPIEFEEVESLEDTDRGSGGFGSTGKK